MMATPQQLRQRVEWRDLIQLNKKEILIELLLPLPWLSAFLFCALQQWYVFALACSFMFFLTAGRLSHGAIHGSLGIRRGINDTVIFICSLFLFSSMHAIQINHLRHHQYCMEAQDVEAMSAKMPWWQAVLIGPWYTIKLHLNAFKFASAKQKSWIILELLCSSIMIYSVLVLLNIAALKFYVYAMLIGQCLTAFFAGWLVHHDTENYDFNARTLDNHWVGRMTLNVFYHAEHHLFPMVPTAKLHVVSHRLKAQTDLRLGKIY